MKTLPDLDGITESKIPRGSAWPFGNAEAPDDRRIASFVLFGGGFFVARSISAINCVVTEVEMLALSTRRYAVAVESLKASPVKSLLGGGIIVADIFTKSLCIPVIFIIRFFVVALISFGTAAMMLSTASFVSTNKFH